MSLFCAGFQKRQLFGSGKFEISIERNDGSSKSKWLSEQDADACYAQLSHKSHGGPLAWSEAVIILNSFEVE